MHNVELLMPRFADIDELVPYDRNARTHDDEQVAQIEASIVEFGWTNPILVGKENLILAGHGRRLAAINLKIRRVPVIDIGHLSEAQQKAYVLADNKIAINSGWDLPTLRGELFDLEAAGIDLSLTGFSISELEEIMIPDLDPDPENDPDAVPETPVVPYSQAGEIWICGPHRVMCGSATVITDWEELLGPERADVVWIDPPYNVDIGAKNESMAKVGKASTKAGIIANDAMGDADFLEFLQEAFSSLFVVMKPGAAIYIAHADREAHQFHNAFRQAGFKFSGCLIWEKNKFVMGRSDYQTAHEPILYGWKPGRAHRWFGGRKQTSIDTGVAPFEKLEDGRWCIRAEGKTLIVDGGTLVDELEPSIVYHARPSRSDDHPSAKPVGLIVKQLRNSARANDIVIDSFTGSGSTMIAAEMLGMCFRGMEIDPRFVDLILQRYYDFTGRVPVNALSGEPFPVKRKADDTAPQK